MSSCLVPIIASLVIAYLTTWYLARPDAALRILDHPNERSLHAHPTPRTGGIAILFGLSIAALWAGLSGCVDWDAGLARAAIGTALLAGVSYADDCVGLRPGPRFLVHVVAAGCLATGPWVPESLDLPLVSLVWPLPVAWALGILFVAWMLNLYNFMDGMDGFAGGMTTFGFATLAIIGALRDETSYAVVNASVAAAAAGFLIINFPPARIFMGDTGSSTLGFLAAASLLWADHAGLFPLWLGILVFSPFVVDATTTLIRRALKREKVWQAHRTHFYQRAVQLGWGHRATVFGEYAIMLGTALSALLLYQDANGWLGALVLSAWTLVYLFIALAIHRAERRRGLARA